MEKVTNHPFESSPCSDTKMLQLSEEVKDSSDWLPKDWILEIRTQKTGANAGRQIKCYYDPSSDSRFYSKKAVFRHLNARSISAPIMRQTRSITAKSVNECCSKTDQEENMKNSPNNALDVHAQNELPEGWTKEIRARKGDRRRKDPFYIDPVSGYEFRSLKDVFRYLETGDILRCAVRPQKRGSGGTCTIVKESQSPTAAKRRDRRGDSVKKCLFTSKGPDTDVKKMMQIHRSPESSYPPQGDHATTASEEDDSNCKMTNIKMLDNRSQECLKLVSPPDFTSFSEKENISCIQHDAAQAHEKALQTEQPHLDEERFPSLVNEKQHALGIDLGPPREENESSPSTNALLSNVKLVLTEHRNEESSDHKKSKRGRKKKADGAITMPVRASKRLAALRDNTSDESKRAEGNSVPFEMDKALGSSTISSLTDEKSCVSKSEHPENLKNQEPLGNEAYLQEQVTSRMLNNVKEEPIFTSPFGDSWPDPCIEFAFKMLTSDIPFLDDLTTVQHNFQQQQMESTLGPSLQHSIGSSGNQGSNGQNGRLNQLNLWNEPFVPFADGMRPHPFQQGLQSCKKVN